MDSIYLILSDYSPHTPNVFCVSPLVSNPSRQLLCSSQRGGGLSCVLVPWVNLPPSSTSLLWLWLLSMGLALGGLSIPVPLLRNKLPLSTGTFVVVKYSTESL